MDTPFTYNRFVVGNEFLSRKKELNTLTTLIRQKINILIYDAPKTGKTSLIQQTSLNLQKLSYNFSICELDLYNVRSENVFLEMLVNKLSDCISANIYDGSIPEKGPIDIAIKKEVLSLPEKVAGQIESNLIIYINEFQNFLQFDEGEIFMELLEKEWSGCSKVSFIFSGSKLNAMKYIFEEKKMFYNFAEYVRLCPIDEKTIHDYISHVFLSFGRVINENLTHSIYQLCEGHPWYIWQIATICFHLTKGYVTDKIIQDATSALISIHQPRFVENIDSLSNFQLNLLRAIFNGETKFCSSDIIEKYDLNSSANVRRLKDALKKKEIVTFNSVDEARIIDPIFKLWLKNQYFVK